MLPGSCDQDSGVDVTSLCSSASYATSCQDSVHATDPVISSTGTVDDGTCVPAQCPAYGYFLTPSYQPHASFADLEAQIVRSQFAVRTLSDDIDLPDRPYGTTGRLPILANPK